MNSGGLRSLVATAVSVASPQRPRVRLLHFRRPSSGDQSAPAGRAAAVLRQADHFNLGEVIEIEDSLVWHQSANPPAAIAVPTSHPVAVPAARLALSRGRRLLAAIAQASLLQAARVVDPCQYNGDFDAITRASEQIILAQHLARLENPDAPSIDTPLAEMTDRQLVELGVHLGVAWEMAWSCDLDGASPCGDCTGCRRRQGMFDATGLEDPKMAMV